MTNGRLKKMNKINFNELARALGLPNIDKKPKVCNYCGRSSVPSTTTERILLCDGSYEEVHSQRCAWCKNLVYGYSKRVPKQIDYEEDI